MKEGISTMLKLTKKDVKDLTLLNSIIDTIPDLFFYKDYQTKNGEYIGCNNAFCKLLNKERKDILGYTDIELFGQEVGKFFRLKDREVLKRYETIINEEWVTYPDNSRVCLATSKTPFYDNNGDITGILGISRDITEEKRLKLKDKQQIQMIEQLPNSIISISLDGYIESWNRGSQVLLGYSKSEVIGKHISSFQQYHNKDNFHKIIEQLMQGGEGAVNTFETYIINKSQTLILVAISLSLLKDEDNYPSQIVASIEDITLRKTKEKIASKKLQTLSYQAHHDALTKVPNKLFFQKKLISAIQKAKQSHSKIALLFIDLDHFKYINDTLGHGTGDKVLKITVSRILKVIRSKDTLSRIGGDEFTIILEDLKTTQNILPICNKISKSLSEPIAIKANTMNISASIGISIYPDDASTIKNLIDFADFAMYKAKKKGKNNAQFYSN